MGSFLGYAERNRVKRLTEDESLENDCRKLQEGLNREITIEGEYFPNYEAVEETYEQFCREIASIKYMCIQEGKEEYCSDEEDLDDSTRENIRMLLQQKLQTGEFNQD